MEQNFNALAQDLRTIALLNPRLALMLARGQPWAPRTYTIPIRWDAVTAEQPIGNNLAERLYQDCWLSDIVYTVECPNIAPGSAWKPEIENAYAKSCGNWIHVSLEVQGPDRYQITNERTPLGAICSHDAFQGKLLDRAWVLSHDQNLRVTAVNTRAFVAVTGVPTILTLTICVKELSGCNLRNISYDEAVSALRKMGYYPEPSEVDAVVTKAR
jgi:hypothetical protein